MTNAQELSCSQSEFLEAAMRQVEVAARLLNIDPGLLKILKEPKRVLTVSIPVRMDNGTVEVFRGYRVQHNLSRGPAKGGISELINGQYSVFRRPCRTFIPAFPILNTES